MTRTLKQKRLDAVSAPLTIAGRYHPANDVTLFHGECLALLQTIPDGAAQLVVTSPPYNIGKVKRITNAAVWRLRR